jgi:hypothetical protein
MYVLFDMGEAVISILATASVDKATHKEDINVPGCVRRCV